MKVSLETRGCSRDLDYPQGCIGAPSCERWWSKKYGKYTTFERPTILVENDNEGWRVYAGAISSTRRDCTRTVIRFNVVLEGSTHNDEKDRNMALDLVQTWLNDLNSNPHGIKVQAILDKMFTEVVVEDLLRSKLDERNMPVESEQIRKALSRLQDPEKQPNPDASQPRNYSLPWAGLVAQDAARKEFLQYAKELLRGSTTGCAVLLNLITTEEDAQEVADKNENTALLLESSNFVRGETPCKLKKKMMFRQIKSVKAVTVIIIVFAIFCLVLVRGCAMQGKTAPKEMVEETRL